MELCVSAQTLSLAISPWMLSVSVVSVTRETALRSSVATYSAPFKIRHYVSTYQKILIYICT